MTRRRWIADEVSENHAYIVGQHADHLVKVLRARVGQEFDVATFDSVRRGKIVSLTADRVEFELGEQVLAPPSLDLTLVLAIFKFDRMEWAIEKCTELGVTRILPMVARRTDSHLAAAATKRIERWQRIARQASEQSRRASIPEIASPAKLSQILNCNAAMRIVLSEKEKAISLREVFEREEMGCGRGEALQPHSSCAAHPQAAVAVGPEGGWNDDELKAFTNAGWTSASLGRNILRAETAAMAAVAVAIMWRQSPRPEGRAQ